MNFIFPAPLGGRAVPLVALLAALTWLVFLWGGRSRRWRRAAIILYLLALGLAIGACILWLAGLFR